jgi:hypothetical protein
MASQTEVKFTEEEIQSLADIQQGYQEMQLKMGGLKMQQIAHDRNDERLADLEGALMDELNELNKNEQKVAQDLSDKYGAGSLNPETGVFTPSPVEEEAAVEEVSTDED